MSMFFLSQETSAMSQLSQDFAERLGHLNVHCTQDEVEDSMASSSDNCKFLAPAPRAIKNPVIAKNTGVSLEDEKQINLRPVNSNPFLSAETHHAEQYFRRPHMHTGMKLPLKIWISAFKDRPRYITDFEEVSLLGEGSFSSVFCVRHRLDGNLYAIKKVKERIQTENHGRLMTREVCAFTALTGCPNLVRYFTSWIDDHQLYMQLELCPLGSLEDLIAPFPSRGSVMRAAGTGLEGFADRSRSDSYISILSETENANTINRTMSHQRSISSPIAPFLSRGIPEELVWLLLYDIACTLCYMHTKQIVHLDIRPANIFMLAACHYVEPIESPRKPATFFQTVMGKLGENRLSKGEEKESIRDKVEAKLLDRSYRIKVGDLGHARGLSETSPVIEGDSRYASLPPACLSVWL